MKPGCVRENELAELLHRGHWPQACSAELKAHVAECRSCSELVLVAGFFQAARKEAASERPPSSASALWWRAQLRRRYQAVERVSKPILGAQLFALAVVLSLGGGAAVWAATRGASFVAWLQEIPHDLNLSAFLPDPLVSSSGSYWWIVPVLATLALISGVVVYIASEKE